MPRAALTSTDDCNADGIDYVEQLQENIEPRSAADSANNSGENLANVWNCLCLELNHLMNFLLLALPDWWETLQIETLMLGAQADLLSLLLLPNARRLLKV